MLLKTIFCCMACDGEIASEEIDLLREIASNTDEFNSLDVEKELNKYISQINTEGSTFLSNYLSEINDANLSEQQELKLVEFAIKTIEADHNVDYSEIKFFKRIKRELKVSDDTLTSLMPDKEDYFLPDIARPEEMDIFPQFGNIKI